MLSQQDGSQRPDADCREALSRLIDGELDEAECRRLLDRLCRDESAQREWTLLNLACDALRSSEVAALHSAGFVARVRSALAAEAPIVAPASRPGTRRLTRRVLLPAAAVAGAAVVLGVVAVPQLLGPATPATALAHKEPVTVPVAPAAPAPQERGIVRSAELEAYLEAHREQAAGPLLPRPTAYQRASATLPPR